MKKALKELLKSGMSMLIGVILCRKILIPKLNQEKQYAEKHLSLFLLMNQWIKVKQEGKSFIPYFERKGYKRIGIYGMSYAGEALLEELKDSAIKIVYAIDKNSDNIYAKVNIVSMDEPLENVDAIVVTAITFFDEIERQLAKKINCPIVSLEDILYEI